MAAFRKPQLAADRDKNHHRGCAGPALLLVLAACAGKQKPPMELTNPDQNRCGGPDCIRAKEWSSPGPNPCPCFDEPAVAPPPSDGTDRPSPTPASVQGAPPHCQAAVAVYVADVETRQILRMAPDGSNVQVLVSGVEANDIDLDVGARKMYWTDHDKDIMRANLDGSEVEVLLKDIPSPYCLALDPEGQRIFWTNQLGNPRVQSSTLDGANVRDLVPGKAEFMIGIAVDPVNRALFWMDGYYRGHVVRAHIDGGNPNEVATTVGIANGVDVDPMGGKVYWTEYGNGPRDDVIRRANLDGSSVETLFDASDGLTTPQHIAVDPAAGKIYWADLHAHRVQRANLDGTGLETIRDGLGYPRGVALLRYPTCEAAAAHVEADRTASPSSWAAPSADGESPPAAADSRPVSGAPTQGYGIIKGIVTLRQPQIRAAGQQAGAEGLPTPDYVEAVAKQQLGGIRACYERELMRQPSLVGKLVIEATIDRKGVVSAARIQQSSSTLGHASSEACVLKAVQRMRFPKVRHDGGVIVRLPLVFSFTTCTKTGVHSRCSR
ncbi:MAG: AgmX/PglI C-terminal domain-containing protein [Deltaproteobacteria bacterium]|nr:AgmX/PglI C-terminal domain-containing protein [Deltaproteobacteria bacterium]